MIFLACADARARLEAFHDRELTVAEQIELESHLETCPVCRGERDSLGLLGEALRQASASIDRGAAVTPGLRAGVISRLTAERHESLPARVGRMFEDMHLVWAALGATAATLVCLAVTTMILYHASPERRDSLSGVLQVLGSPGSNDNPVQPHDRRVQLPRLPETGLMPAVLVQNLDDQTDMLLAFSAVVTREGQVTDLSLLKGSGYTESVSDLLDAVSTTRFEPARFGEAPVAVNLVWLLAHTTVRAKAG